LNSPTMTSLVQTSTTMSVLLDKSFRPALTAMSNAPENADRKIRAAPLKRSRSQVEADEAVRNKHILMSSSPPRPDANQENTVQEATTTLFSIPTTMDQVTRVQNNPARKYRLGTSRSYR
jgi:hypothetical protein